jgi:hypothetical protein
MLYSCSPEYWAAVGVFRSVRRASCGVQEVEKVSLPDQGQLIRDVPSV